MLRDVILNFAEKVNREAPAISRLPCKASVFFDQVRGEELSESGDAG
jgi:hypothetical protein